MQQDQIMDFTRRLSQCNLGEMIVIMYDIYFAYEAEALKALENADHEAFKDAVHKGQNVLTRLMNDLDFKYPVAHNLFALYRYVQNQWAISLYKNKPEGIAEGSRIMKPLYDAFVEAAKQDTSKPLMSNTQQVYAGMTYGRQQLNENYTQMGHDRGFFA